MPKTVVSVLKVPTGSKAPNGYTFVRSLKNVDLYHSTRTESTVNDLDAMMKAISVGQPVVAQVVPSSEYAAALIQQLQTTPEAELEAMMFGMKIAGRKKTHRNKKGKGKGKKGTRRH